MTQRVELRTRTQRFDRALQAEVRDALWMLARQWQMGEFQGDDAGSPIQARIRVTSTRLRKYRGGEATGAVETLDDGVPLETKVERRPLVFSLDLRMLMGRQWLKMMPFHNMKDDFIAAYPVAAPDPAKDAGIVAHPEAWSAFAAAAGRAMDGARLYEHLLKPGSHAYDGMHVPPPKKAPIDEAAKAFVRWFERVFSQPPKESNAWLPDRLEYQFACAAPLAGAKEKTLVADEYYHGRLDWYSVDHGTAPIGGSGIPAGSGVPHVETREVVMTPASFEGMPNTRWWTFEDGRTNFGDIKPDTTDLAKLLLIEFGLTYANDWFVIPHRLASGSIAKIDGLTVTNVFGERIWIQAAGRGKDDAWHRWAMFVANTKGNWDENADTSLLMLPVAPKVLESEPLEEVLLVRDEMANMVWAIENVVPLPDGTARRGLEAARETRAFYERTSPPDAPPEPAADLRYEIMNTVPENWIPFVPVHIPGDRRSIQLQRGAMLRVLAGDKTEKIRPRTQLMREGLAAKRSYFLHEEEVPRAGVIVSQSYQRTRWRDGRPWVWLGARKQTGRGEESSGLAFDRLLPVPKK
ncbi:MAG TPA: hypothetical protein VF432_03675 [Thermoanaerobaculia bacterium]